MPDYRLILFIAGDAPRSRRARTNLRTLLRRVDYRGQLTLEEVDVLRDPARSLASGIVATPAAVLVGADGQQQRLYGDLAEEHHLTALLAPITE